MLYQMKILTTTKIKDKFRNSKDERLSLVNMPKGLVESLNNSSIELLYIDSKKCKK